MFKPVLYKTFGQFDQNGRDSAPLIENRTERVHVLPKRNEKFLKGSHLAVQETHEITGTPPHYEAFSFIERKMLTHNIALKQFFQRFLVRVMEKIKLKIHFFPMNVSNK